MEFVAATAVIIAVCLILGIKIQTLVTAAILLLLLASASMAVLFFVMFIRILLSKPVKAQFSRIDRSPYFRYKTAYYIVDGVEYPNVFPEEGHHENRLYKKEKQYTVLLSRKKKCVFDRFAIATCTLGTLFCAALPIGAALLISIF
ncbi:MAG: hypothetical protein IIY35_07330 [Ruminococcus sp.]|jgi:hypothetical protein|nr:hypothetical protein [Ruminococcus sp.]